MLVGYHCDRCGGDWVVGGLPVVEPSEAVLKALAECPYCASLESPSC